MNREPIAQQTRQCSMVLLGQQFGGGHERGGQAMTQALQQGGQSDRGLAGTNITLQQAVHGHGSLEILANVLDGSGLSTG